MKITISRFLLTIAFSGLLLLTAAGHANGNVKFSWAIIGKTNDEERSLDISSTINLRTGDELQIYIDQGAGTFLYLFLLDSAGALVLLHPENILSYASGEGVKQEVFIPDQENTFLVSPPAGTEKLYLLASPERLEKLENLVTSFIQAPDDIAARSAVLKEIKKLRRQHSTLTQATETGVPIAGTIITRSLLPSRLQATQVATDGFYSRIIRIKHD